MRSRNIYILGKTNSPTRSHTNTSRTNPSGDALPGLKHTIESYAHAPMSQLCIISETRATPLDLLCSSPREHCIIINAHLNNPPTDKTSTHNRRPSSSSLIVTLNLKPARARASSKNMHTQDVPAARDATSLLLRALRHARHHSSNRVRPVSAKSFKPILEIHTLTAFCACQP